MVATTRRETAGLGTSTTTGLSRRAYITKKGVVHGHGMKIRQGAKRGDVVVRHRVDVVAGGGPTVCAGRDFCPVDDNMGGVYINAPTRDGRQQRVVLVPGSNI